MKRAYCGPSSISKADNKSDQLTQTAINSSGNALQTATTATTTSSGVQPSLSKSGGSLMTPHGGPPVSMRGGPPVSQSGIQSKTNHGPVMTQHGGPLWDHSRSGPPMSQDVTMTSQPSMHKVRIKSPKSPRAMAAHILTPQATPDRASNASDPVDKTIPQMHSQLSDEAYPQRKFSIPTQGQIQSPSKAQPKTLAALTKKPLSTPSFPVPPKPVQVSPINYHQGPPHSQYQVIQGNVAAKKNQTQNIPEVKRMKTNVPDLKQLDAYPLQKAQAKRQVEDEILLKSRELDMCWHEDEIDCVRVSLVVRKLMTICLNGRVWCSIVSLTSAKLLIQFGLKDYFSSYSPNQVSMV